MNLPNTQTMPNVTPTATTPAPLYINLFRDSPALVELQPQGDASIPVTVAPAQLAELKAMLMSAEASAALAALFLAGVTVGERTRYTGKAAR